MIRITDKLSIPETEFTFTASRSSGPGGQNVNKVNSRVTLAFDIAGSPSLSEDQRKRILRGLGSRINKDGVLRIASQRTRSQELNRVDVLEKFTELVRKALTPRRRRIRTSIPAAEKDRRIQLKKKRTAIKQSRSKGNWDA